jgi:hypothetical protein
MRRQWTWIALLGLLAGCAAPGATGNPGAEAMPRFNGFCRCADAAELLMYHQRLRGMSSEELGAEYTTASQAFSKQKSDSARLRLAMLLDLPGTTFHDDARAQALAEEVAKGKNPEGSALRPLAALIAANVAEQRRQDERNQKLAQRLQEEEKRAEALQQKLDGLKAIEKNLLNREPTKPVNVK